MNDFYIFRKKLRLLLQRANIEKKYTQNTENKKKISILNSSLFIIHYSLFTIHYFWAFRLSLPTIPPTPSGFSGVRFAPVLRCTSLNKTNPQIDHISRRSFQLAPPSAPFKSLTRTKPSVLFEV